MQTSEDAQVSLYRAKRKIIINYLILLNKQNYSFPHYMINYEYSVQFWLNYAKSPKHAQKQ